MSIQGKDDKGPPPHTYYRNVFNLKLLHIYATQIQKPFSRIQHVKIMYIVEGKSIKM